MDVFYVRELVFTLYIGHEVPFCKKFTIYTMLYALTHTFHGTFFMNLIVSAFYVDEYMNFKVFEFQSLSISKCVNFMCINPLIFF